MDPSSDFTRNRTAYFHTKYDRALALFNSSSDTNNNKALADDLCRELLADYTCPRFLQVRAWEIRSLCTENYFDAKGYLLRVGPLLDRVPVELGVEEADWEMWEEITAEKLHAEAMLEELEKAWVEGWEAIGKAAPRTREEAVERNEAARIERRRARRLMREARKADAKEAEGESEKGGEDTLPIRGVNESL